MSEGVWIPGGGDEVVPRLQRAIARYLEEAGVARAFVVAELADGARFALEALLEEPGGGFLTLVPHREDDETPERLIVPLSSLRRIELARAEAQRARLGFAGPLEPADLS